MHLNESHRKSSETYIPIITPSYHHPYTITFIIILSVHHHHLMGARETFLVRLEIRGLEDREPGKTTRTTTAAR